MSRFLENSIQTHLGSSIYHLLTNEFSDECYKSNPTAWIFFFWHLKPSCVEIYPKGIGGYIEAPHPPFAASRKTLTSLNPQFQNPLLTKALKKWLSILYFADQLHQPRLSPLDYWAVKETSTTPAVVLCSPPLITLGRSFPITAFWFLQFLDFLIRLLLL